MLPQPQNSPQPNQPQPPQGGTPLQNMLGANQQPAPGSQPPANTPSQPMMAQHIQDPNGNSALPHQQQPNPFSAAIPGQSLTDSPKNAKWEHPPQFTDVNKALNYVFDQIVMPVHLRMFFAILGKGKTIEDMARIILFAGFSEGKWTQDLAMLMSRPLIYMLSGIAHRAGLKGTKISSKDRSGFDNIVKLQKLRVSSSSPQPTPVDSGSSSMSGLMAPKG